MSDDTKDVVLLMVVVLGVLAIGLVLGFLVGKEQGCDQVGGTLGQVRTDSHVYRVCR